MEHATLELGDGRRIAYRRSEGQGPGVVFLGGFRSDMTGTKARFLEAWARARGQGYLRFDYTGHGASSGDFRGGAIGDWARDAQDAVVRLTEGPQVLVGSSMGGWIALILAGRIRGGSPGWSGSRRRRTSPRTRCGPGWTPGAGEARSPGGGSSCRPSTGMRPMRLRGG